VAATDHARRLDRVREHGLGTDGIGRLGAGGGDDGRQEQKQRTME
jgi:hypothetical protein